MEEKYHNYDFYAPVKRIAAKIAWFLLAVAFLFGSWVGIRAWEVHQGKDLLTEIINVRPVVYPTDGETIDEFGRVTLTLGSEYNFEYVVVQITLDYDTYMHIPNGKGDLVMVRFEDIEIGFNGVCAGTTEKIVFQLTPEQLEHLENVYYSIEECKLR